MVPARIENGQIRLLTGTSTIGQNGKPNGPQYAAWLPRYIGKWKSTDYAVKYLNGTLPQHGDEVDCWVELFQHHRWNKKQRKHIPDFQYWQVRAIAKAGSAISKINPTQAGKPCNERSWHEPKGSIKKIHGWVCITNANINRKHDERVFFDGGEGTPPGPYPINDELRRKWMELIENYQEIHQEDLKRRERQSKRPDEYLGPDPGKTAWSRHVYTKEERELRDGTLCYARLKNGTSDVDALFPVMIARDLYAASPWDLLDPSLRPASSIKELSPADRVFGWVLGDADDQQGATKNPTAIRGLLRVEPVTCNSTAENAVKTFSGAGLPLAILAAPKPQQGRFYVAANPQGKAQDDGFSKIVAGYDNGKGLRGRKVFPHHGKLPDDFWKNPLEDRTQSANAPWQEYRRPKKDGQEQRDDQNRSILGWVKPGAEFSFNIHVMNLSRVEIGALLWLLSLPENHFHRFGGGKPLGFGSVRLSVEKCELWTEASLRERYRSWISQSSSQNISEECMNAFKDAALRVYDTGRRGVFKEISFINLNCAIRSAIQNPFSSLGSIASIFSFFVGCR